MLALLGNFLSIAVNLGVGGRILAVARGPERRTERLLGWGLVWDGLEWLFWLLSVYTPLDGTPPGIMLGVMCRIGIVIASCFLLAFTRAVFYSRSRWFIGYAAISAAAMVVGIGFSITIADWHGYRVDLPWVWLETTGVLLAYASVFVAAAAYYGTARRRLKLQIGDPVVVNRILLWASYGAAMVASQIAYTFALTLAGLSGHYPLVLDSVIGGFTGLGCAFLWLAFFPPQRYLRWVSSMRPADGEPAGTRPDAAPS